MGDLGSYIFMMVSGVVPMDDHRLEWVRSRAVHKFMRRFGLSEMRFIIEDILEEKLLDDEIIVQNGDAKKMVDRLCR
jgi:hypothetical protein